MYPSRKHTGEFPRGFPPTDVISDGTDTDHCTEPAAEAKPEQRSPSDINPCSTNFDLRQNLKPNCIDDYRY